MLNWWLSGCKMPMLAYPAGLQVCNLCLQFVIVVFPDHTHLLFSICVQIDNPRALARTTMV